MAINKKLIHFKTKENFNREVANNNILESSICFILDTKEIYTHGLLYDGSKVDLSNIEETISKIKIDGNGLMYLNDKGEYKIPLIIVDSEEELNSITPEIGTRAVVRTVVEGFDNLNLAEIINGEETNVPADMFDALDKYAFKVTSVDTSILFPYLDGEHAPYELFTFDNGVDGVDGFIIVTNLDGSSIPNIYINDFSAHIPIYSGNDYDFYWYDYNILERIITMTNIMNLINKDQNVINAFLLFSTALNVSIIANKEYTDYYYTSNGWVLSGYMTEQLLLANLLIVSEQIPTKISQLENDANYTSSNNLKTINGESILGEGDIVIEGGSSDTYYLELPLGEDVQCLSSGILTQEQFEGISNCSVLIVRTAHMDSEEVLGSEDITFNWKISQTERYEGGSKTYAYSNLCPNLGEACFVLYAITFYQYEGVCSYELAKKRFVVDTEITDPTDAFISTNSVYELDLSSGTTLENGYITGNITKEEFDQITISKNIIVNTGQFKFSLTQKFTFTDMLVFYGNIYYDGITQRLVLNVKANGNEYMYMVQLVPIVYELDLSSGTTLENGYITGNITKEEFDQIIEAESLAIKLGDHKVTFNQKSTSDRQSEYLFYGIYNDYEKEKIVLLIVLHDENDYVYEIRTQELGGGGSAYSEVNHGTSDTTFTLTPNTFHIWDIVTTLDLDFSTETENIANEYLFQFTSGTEPTSLSLPDTIKWASQPNIQSNKIYQISILNNLGTILEFEV